MCQSFLRMMSMLREQNDYSQAKLAEETDLSVSYISHIENAKRKASLENIRSIRKSRGMGQTELVQRLQLIDVTMTRETLVKIERGIQHIQASQLRGIRDVLETTYDELCLSYIAPPFHLLDIR